MAHAVLLLVIYSQEALIRRMSQSMQRGTVEEAIAKVGAE
jgi:hypothetical protein